MIEQLKALKQRGDTSLKDFDSPIPQDCMITINDWVISYVREQTPINIQSTVCISKTDTQPFHLKDIPKEIFQVFPNSLYIESRDFPNRGFCFLIIMKNNLSIS